MKLLRITGYIGHFLFYMTKRAFIKLTLWGVVSSGWVVSVLDQLSLITEVKHTFPRPERGLMYTLEVTGSNPAPHKTDKDITYDDKPEKSSKIRPICLKENPFMSGSWKRILYA